MMDANTALYACLVGWFAYTSTNVLGQICRFQNFEKRYGHRENITLNDLITQAEESGEDLPSFNIYVPAFKEYEVIEETIRNLVRSNYPKSHFTVNIISYADDLEPSPQENTTSVVRKTAEELNSAYGLDIVRSIEVPAGYDGFFPGSLDSEEPHIGKPRGLNYAIRKTHENNERDERMFFLGSMYRSGEMASIDDKISRMSDRVQGSLPIDAFVQAYFCPDSPQYLSSLASSKQLERLAALANTIPDVRSRADLIMYIKSQAPRFFYDAESAAVHVVLKKMEGKQFLTDVMLDVEDMDPEGLMSFYEDKVGRLTQDRPILSAKLASAKSAEEIYQLSKQINSRWMIVYDADADAPRDVMRYLAARILTDPEALAFQGPVAPVGNLDDVTHLPRMAGYQMAFYHFALYPSLLLNKRLAHPLAGTNWCLRMEGIDEYGRIRTGGTYDEAKRTFLASFNPLSLTEDLELGLRLFDDFGINAEWHPYVEIEQVPPDRQALLKQRTRWAEGTIALLKYIWNSDIPLDQKLYYMAYPAKAVVSAATPAACLMYLGAYAAGITEPQMVFGDIPLYIAAANLCTPAAFALSCHATKKYVKANLPNDELYFLGKSLKERESFAPGDLAAISDIVSQMRNGLSRKGFLTQYTNIRSTDEAFQESERMDADRLSRLTDWIPSADQYAALCDDLDEIVRTEASRQGLDMRKGKIYSEGIRIEPDYDQIGPRMQEIIEMNRDDPLEMAKRIGEAIIFSYPYTFHDMIPPLKAIYRRLTGTVNQQWDKTARTRKKAK